MYFTEFKKSISYHKWKYLKYNKFMVNSLKNDKNWVSDYGKQKRSHSIKNTSVEGKAY